MKNNLIYLVISFLIVTTIFSSCDNDCEDFIVPTECEVSFIAEFPSSDFDTRTTLDPNFKPLWEPNSYIYITNGDTGVSFVSNNKEPSPTAVFTLEYPDDKNRLDEILKSGSFYANYGNYSSYLKSMEIPSEELLDYNCLPHDVLISKMYNTADLDLTSPIKLSFKRMTAFVRLNIINKSSILNDIRINYIYFDSDNDLDNFAGEMKINPMDGTYSKLPNNTKRLRLETLGYDDSFFFGVLPTTIKAGNTFTIRFRTKDNYDIVKSIEVKDQDMTIQDGKITTFNLTITDNDIYKSEFEIENEYGYDHKVLNLLHEGILNTEIMSLLHDRDDYDDHFHNVKIKGRMNAADLDVLIHSEYEMGVARLDLTHVYFVSDGTKYRNRTADYEWKTIPKDCYLDENVFAEMGEISAIALPENTEINPNIFGTWPYEPGYTQWPITICIPQNMGNIESLNFGEMNVQQIIFHPKRDYYNYPQIPVFNFKNSQGTSNVLLKLDRSWEGFTEGNVWQNMTWSRIEFTNSNEGFL